jgi:hypothetical protein
MLIPDQYTVPNMKIYNLVGVGTLALQLLLSVLLAPPWLGPWWGMAIGFAYLLLSWFLGGLYLSDIIHLGIAHRALDYKQWRWSTTRWAFISIP